jgi:hypothetical protein
MTRSPRLDAPAPTLQLASARPSNHSPPSLQQKKSHPWEAAPAGDVVERRGLGIRGQRSAARPKVARVYSSADEAYIARLGSRGEWGGQLAACALARRYGRPIRIWRQCEEVALWISEVGHYCPSGVPGGLTVHLRYDGSHYQWVDARQAPAADAPGGGFALVDPPYTDAGAGGDCLFLSLAYGLNYAGYGSLLRAYALCDEGQVRWRAVGMGVNPAFAAVARLSRVMRRCRVSVALRMRQDLVEELRAHSSRYADSVAAARVERSVDARDRVRGLRSAAGWPLGVMDGSRADILATLFG